MLKRDTLKFSRGEYDLLVIGGGINGAAIANLGAYNGLNVALIEKNDFAGGTSGKSTKLLHGGLRYLANLEFDLVRESLRERMIQLTNAPHLAKPLGFIIPAYQTDRRPLWMLRLGVALYDWLSGKFLIEKHRRLSAQDVVNLLPGIEATNLVGGVLYFDAQMDDARICLENALSAAQQGAHVANYVEARAFIKENGKAVGVEAVDLLSQRLFQIRAKRVVCAVGPWTNQVLAKENRNTAPKVRTTKGIHIVYRGKISPHAVVISNQKDGRIFFLIPWKEESLIGTTDTDYQGNLDDVRADDGDIDYLFSEAARVFPHIAFDRQKIITTFAGLRPLVFSPGNPSRVSRKHAIEESYSKTIYVMGGKYTTYRKIAEDVLAKVMKSKLKDTTQYYPLVGNQPSSPASPGHIPEPEFPAGLDVNVVQALKELYGSRYTEVLSFLTTKEDANQRICSCSTTIKAQVYYAVESEMACRPEDIMERRLGLVYHSCPKGDCRKAVQAVLSQYGF
jgi:glycerol-3-phosphate dehydrogenase